MADEEPTGAYENNLTHIAEPQKPDDRADARSITLEDWEALWFAEVLRDYAHYEAESPHSGIAVGLASYIDAQVREHASHYVSLYLHTDEAVEAVTEAWRYDDSEVYEGTPSAVVGDKLIEVGFGSP